MAKVITARENRTSGRCIIAKKAKQYKKRGVIVFDLNTAAWNPESLPIVNKNNSFTFHVETEPRCNDKIRVKINWQLTPESDLFTNNDNTDGFFFGMTTYWSEPSVVIRSFGNMPLRRNNSSYIDDKGFSANPLFAGFRGKICSFTNPVILPNTNFRWCFLGSFFNSPINHWDVSNVIDMGCAFIESSFDQCLSNWDVSNVIRMDAMFAFASNFNKCISNWNVSNVTRMDEMFCNALNFNKDISKWNVSKVTDMAFMFYYATAFNKDISKWNVSKVTDMSFMFYCATVFDQDISKWNVSKVTNMACMFLNAISFNQDISKWNVSNVVYMDAMFYNYYPEGLFEKFPGVGNWNYSKVQSIIDFIYNTSSRDENYHSEKYDEFLVNLSKNATLPSDLNMGGTGFDAFSEDAVIARDYLRNVKNMNIIEHQDEPLPEEDNSSNESTLRSAFSRTSKNYEVKTNKLNFVKSLSELIENIPNKLRPTFISIHKPAVQEPTVQEPAVQEPVVKEPVVQEPVVQEPAIISNASRNMKKIVFTMN